MTPPAPQANPPPKAPPAVLAYGGAGVLPFWLLTATAILRPDWNGVAGAIVAIYAGLILSFLGGARWGLEVRAPAPRPMTITLAMLPTLAALGIVVVAHGNLRGQLIAFGLALLGVWAWDLGAAGLPPWYRNTRTLLTLGAVAGLSTGALLVSG